MQFRSNLLVSLVTFGIALPNVALATEAAMGRYTPGLFAMPGVGIVQPIPGVYWPSSSFAYFGSAGKDLEIPINGTTQFGLFGEIITAGIGILPPPFFS